MTSPTQIPSPPTLPEPRPAVTVPMYYTTDQMVSFGNSWLARDAAQTAEIERLKKLVPAPPEPTRTRWGVNASTVEELARREGAFGGKVDVVRYSHQPTEGIWFPADSPKAADRIVLGDRRLIYSAKAPVKEQATGKWNANWERMMRRCPTNRDTYVCPWHEPEDDVKKGLFTTEDLREAFRQVVAVARKVGPHIRVIPILMNYSLLPVSGRDWHDFYPGDDLCDGIGWDVYQGSLTWPAYPDRLFDGVQAASESVGKPWLICETGVNSNEIKGVVRYEVLATLADELDRRKPLAVAYFDNDYWQISNDPKAVSAWFDGL